MAEEETVVAEERMITIELPFMDQTYQGWFPKIAERCVVMLNAIKTGVDVNEEDLEILKSFHEIWFKGWHVMTKQIPALPKKKSVQKGLFDTELTETPTKNGMELTEVVKPDSGIKVEPTSVKPKNKKK